MQPEAGQVEGFKPSRLYNKRTMAHRKGHIVPLLGKSHKHRSPRVDYSRPDNKKAIREEVSI